MDKRQLHCKELVQYNTTAYVIYESCECFHEVVLAQITITYSPEEKYKDITVIWEAQYLFASVLLEPNPYVEKTLVIRPRPVRENSVSEMLGDVVQVILVQYLKLD
jgi:hypothetical protein